MQYPPSSPEHSTLLLPGFAPKQAMGKDRVDIYNEASNAAYPSPLPTSVAEAPSSPVPTRRPLGTVVRAVLPQSGDPITVGRSSKSSTLAVASSNKLVSRVHLRLHYDRDDNLVVVECLGHNGLIVHVPFLDVLKGKRDLKSYPVVRNQSVYIERVDGITVDLHGEKVLIECAPSPDATDEEDEPEDLHTTSAVKRSSPALKEACKRVCTRVPSETAESNLDTDQNEPNVDTLTKENDVPEPVQEPVMDLSESKPLEPEISSGLPKSVEIDEPQSDDVHKSIEPALDESKPVEIELSESIEVETLTTEPKQFKPLETELPEAERFTVDTGLSESLENEVNIEPCQVTPEVSTSVIETPVVKSVEIEPRVTQSAEPTLDIHAQTHNESKQTLSVELESNLGDSQTEIKESKTQNFEDVKQTQQDNEETSEAEVRRKLINSIAFSRLVSVPYSSVIETLREAASMSQKDLEELIADTPCLGIIQREGKDAAGRPLENEYYYMAENDADESRTEVVSRMKGKRSIRSCRMTHKQYFYKKPKK